MEATETALEILTYKIQKRNWASKMVQKWDSGVYAQNSGCQNLGSVAASTCGCLIVHKCLEVAVLVNEYLCIQGIGFSGPGDRLKFCVSLLRRVSFICLSCLEVKGCQSCGWSQYARTPGQQHPALRAGRVFHPSST